MEFKPKNKKTQVLRSHYVSGSKSGTQKSLGVFDQETVRRLSQMPAKILNQLSYDERGEVSDWLAVNVPVIRAEQAEKRLEGAAVAIDEITLALSFEPDTAPETLIASLNATVRLTKALRSQGVTLKSLRAVLIDDIISQLSKKTPKGESMRLRTVCEIATDLNHPKHEACVQRAQIVVAEFQAKGLLPRSITLEPLLDTMIHD